MLDHEKIQSLRKDGLTYQEIADEIGTTKASIAGFFWRNRNPVKQKDYDRNRYINTVVGVQLKSRKIKKQIIEIAEKEGKSVSTLCFELIVEGYKHKYMKPKSITRGENT